MIKRITKNSDIKFCVNDDSKIADKFIIKFYTIDKSNSITCTAEDCINEGEKRYIKLNWLQLKTMQSGMLNYECMNLSNDADYSDGVYNETFTRTTYYYIYTDSSTDSGATVDGLNARVTELETTLNNETSNRQDKDNQITASLNTEITRATAKENELSEKIDDLKVNGGKLQDVQVNGKSVVSNKVANIDISSKAEKSEVTSEATARQTEDEKITASLNTEITRAKNAEGTITLSLSSETTNRTSADSKLQKNIDDEVKARTTADTTLTNTLNSVDARVKYLENKEVWDFGIY